MEEEKWAIAELKQYDGYDRPEIIIKAINIVLQSLENKDKEIAQLKLDFKGTTFFCKDCVDKDKEIKELKELNKSYERIIEKDDKKFEQLNNKLLQINLISKESD